jgi:hypothetical protein
MGEQRAQRKRGIRQHVFGNERLRVLPLTTAMQPEN